MKIQVNIVHILNIGALSSQFVDNEM